MNHMLLREPLELTAVPELNSSWTTVRSRLAAIDWSFANRGRAQAVEAIHPYPAKFIGDIPRALLEALPLPKDTVVFDPFVGCGTTLMEAQRRGVPSVGVDLNPIVCLIARVKTGPLPSALSEVAERISVAARKNKSPRRWCIPNVDHWFKTDIQTAVAALVDEINGISQSSMRDALRMALSSILVRVSKQDSDTRYAAVEKAVSSRDVYDSFTNSAEKLHKALLEREWALTPARVIEGDTLTELLPVRLTPA